MKKPTLTAALCLLASLTAGAAVASEIFDIYGIGTTEQESRNDARSQGGAACAAAGYSSASVEVVQTYSSGGGYITYAIAQCF